MMVPEVQLLKVEWALLNAKCRCENEEIIRRDADVLAGIKPIRILIQSCVNVHLLFDSFE